MPDILSSCYCVRLMNKLLSIFMINACRTHLLLPKYNGNAKTFYPWYTFNYVNGFKQQSNKIQSQTKAVTIRRMFISEQ